MYMLYEYIFEIKICLVISLHDIVKSVVNLFGTYLYFFSSSYRYIKLPVDNEG